MSNPLVSVVLPAKDEAGCLGSLLREIGAAMAEIPHEIIVVDDGSTDGTAAVALAARGTVHGLRVLQHTRSCGQSAAVRTGVEAARGRFIATLDADGQNPAAELPRIVAPLLASDLGARLGLVQGRRRVRHDTWSKRAGSRVANAIRQALLHDGVRDSGCGLRAFPRDLYMSLPYFDHMHRFMPAMVRREGWSVTVVDVAHAERRTGRSKYGNLSRAVVGVVDLMGVAWLLRRRRLPQAREVLHASEDASGRLPTRSLPPVHDDLAAMAAGLTS